MILMIDNYDSFTYNLVQYFQELGATVKVVRNDKISVAEAKALRPQFVVISPGPGAPDTAGISIDLIREMTGTVPILGVCLGHQAIGAAFGGKIVRAKNLMHGKTSRIFHKGTDIFKGLLNPFEATRYHSLLIERASFPKCLEVTAWTRDREIMGLRHKKEAVYGVQFHPESIMTGSGKMLLKNFLSL